MTKQSQPVEVNRFVRGLITEASPLNFPEDASVDEDNFVLNRDGTRDRRLGMDYEIGHSIINTNYSAAETIGVAVSTYDWEDVSEEGGVSFTVVQVGTDLYFHDQVNQSLSSEVAGQVTIGTNKSSPFSFATIDGDLVVATGSKELTLVKYDLVAKTFSQEQFSISIRDTFGVEDQFMARDITDGGDVGWRPTFLSDNHLYNLRNQSWGVERNTFNEASLDPIQTTGFTGKYPSNADILSEFVRPDPDSSKQLIKYFVDDWDDVPPYNNAAPKGYFIIDAMSRGVDRTLQYNENMDKFSGLSLELSNNLSTDSTPGGATQVTEYAGRVWYAGFTGSVEGGDSKSPRLSKYVMFSQVVQQPTDVGKCYQKGDPTDPDTSDIVADDGGIIRISGLGNVLKLIAIGSQLFVIATNGVWRVGGGSDFGFSAENFEVTKVTEQGPAATRTVVEVDSSIVYWGEDGIYRIGQSETGQWRAENLTEKTIQRFYDAIPNRNKSAADGIFDRSARKIRWLYPTAVDNNSPANLTSQRRELVLDVTLGAFYTSTITFSDSALAPLPISYVKTRPYSNTDLTSDVSASMDLVEVGGDQVVISENVRDFGSSEVKYFTTLFPNLSANLAYTFSQYRDDGFVDWRTFDGIGVDAAGYLLTGETLAGDSSREKQLQYVTIHMAQTETTLGADYELENQSGCMVRAQWGFSNSANSGRWSKQFEAYRLRRHYIPEMVGDPFDNGFYVVTTKNKVRGRGESFSLHFETEPGKDCRVLGWNLGLTGNPVV